MHSARLSQYWPTSRLSGSSLELSPVNGAESSVFSRATRLFECLVTSFLARHKAKLRQLWDGAEDEGVEPDAHEAYPRYPLTEDEEDVLPTRLGNILLAAERYPLSRYGMDTIYFWPRLFPLLPEKFQNEYEEFILNYEFPLVVAFESMVAAV
jgi:hypothetical protein